MLPRRTAHAPKGKLRGKRRYFRSVAAHAREQQVEPGPDAWWNHWHHHADWAGWGNVRWRYRREHLRALCTVYLSIVEQAAAFETPFQAWIFLDEADAGTDATYLHTPNPHSAFPHRIEVAWGPSPLQPLFAQLLPARTLQLGTLGPATERQHVIWAPGFGVSPDGLSQ